MATTTKSASQYCLIGFLCLRLISPLFAQTPTTDLKQLSPANGLTSNESNWYIYKDSRDWVWISSGEGVFKYDGSSIKHYPAEGHFQSIYDGNIQSDFYEDSSGDIWFASDQAVNCYCRSRDAF